MYFIPKYIKNDEKAVKNIIKKMEEEEIKKNK